MKASQTLYGLQYLRAIAALMVVVRHAYQVIGQSGDGSIGRSFEIGSAGVDLFFVISGFIMCYISDAPSTTAAGFFKSRLARVAPPYWLITLLAAALIVLMPAAFRTSRVTPELLATSLAFVAWPHPSMDGALPIYLIGWTLNYEFAFYALMSVCIVAGRRRRVWLASGALAVAVAVGAVLGPQNDIAAFYTNSILLEFVFGMLIWKLWRAFVAPRWLAIACVALGVVALVVAAQTVDVGRDSWWRCLVWGVPSALTVFGVLGLERAGAVPKIAAFKFVGDASYAIYLVHFLGIGALRVAWNAVPALPDALVLVVAFVGSIVAGGLFYVLIEKRLVALARELLSARRRKAAPAESMRTLRPGLERPVPQRE